MTNDSSISKSDIKVVDLYIALSDEAYADVSIERPYVYYCMGSHDTREDGRMTLSDGIIDSIFEAVANPADSDLYDGVLNVRLVATLSDGHTVSIDKGKASATGCIIDALERAHMEFMFLSQFARYLK